MSDDGDREGHGMGLTVEQQRRVQEALPKAEQYVRRMTRGFRPERVKEVRSAAYEALSLAGATYDPSGNGSFKAHWWPCVYWATRDAIAGRPRGRKVPVSALRGGLRAAAGLRDETSVLTGTRADFTRHVEQSLDELAVGYALGFDSMPVQAAGEEGIVLLEDHATTLTTLRATLAAFPPDGRQILERRYLEGQTAREVAVALGISKSTVDRRCAELRARLREALEAQGIEDLPALLGQAPPDEGPWSPRGE